MQEMNAVYRELGISSEVLAYGNKIEQELKERFAAIDDNAEYNQMKVLLAMQKNKVSEACLYASSGYGYNDLGRDTLEDVYADAFHTEAALVRPQITCGTHALAVALSANLLPGDELLSPVGAPYDTLEEVIGIRESKCSLEGVWRHLCPGGPEARRNLRLRRHPGEDQRPHQAHHHPAVQGVRHPPLLLGRQIGELIAFCKGIKPDVKIMVDNCYGEFVETIEPSDLGADMVVGSLIKNPGGGLAPIGGYICGHQGVCGKCGLPSHLPRSRKRGRCHSWREPALLPGLLPGTDRGGRSAERRCLCSQYL